MKKEDVYFLFRIIAGISAIILIGLIGLLLIDTPPKKHVPRQYSLTQIHDALDSAKMFYDSSEDHMDMSTTYTNLKAVKKAYSEKNISDMWWHKADSIYKKYKPIVDSLDIATRSQALDSTNQISKE